MFLKSLTVRGFKSFADQTSLDFEPGVTVIVGPNGSGKSNVVDALAWVLGTRSAKLLRGGELADVIFAGSPNRPALGSAKVEITIDNSKGQLGSDAIGTGGSAQGFSEVRISREIFTTGESVYAMNGEECRLLDIQELLSDTGLGRELHTIVGQGQLDDILHAKPEDRRAFVEEAAGILKHRRRRERALRKLDHVDEHVEKLRTVLRELRRQLKPLERQAEAADKHQALQAQLRDVQVRLAVHDLSRLRGVRDSEAADDAEISQRQQAIEERVADLDSTAEGLETALREGAPRLEQARDTVEALARLRERLNGTADLVEARRRHLLEYVEEPLAGRPPDELRAQAQRLDERREAKLADREEAQRALDEAAAATREAQISRREHDRRLAAEARARSEARERYAHWRGEVRSHRNAIAASEAERARLEAQLEDLEERATGVEDEVETVQDEIRRLDAEEWQFTERLEQAQSQLQEAEQQLEEVTVRERELERERASQAARAEALRTAATPAGDGATALLGSGLDGVQGLLADHVQVVEGAEDAVSAALGPLGEAVVARSTGHAGTAIAHLRGNRAGRAIVLAGRPGEHGHAVQPAAPEDTAPIIELLEARDAESEPVYAALRHALATTFVAPDWQRAVELQERHPDLTFVTRHGDVAGPYGFVGGSDPERSAMLTAAAAEEAERRVAVLDEQVAAAQQEVERARGAVAERRRALEDATAAINESDARITGAAEQLARLNKELESLSRQRDLVREQRAELVATVERHHEALAALQRDAVDEPVDEPVDEDDDEADRLDEAIDAARQAELDARLTVERIDEQARHLEQAATDLRDEAAEVETALAEAARRRELRREHLRRCGTLSALVEESLEKLDRSIERAEAQRDRLVRERGERDERLTATRAQLRETTTELEEVRERRHESELRRAEVRHHLDEVEHRLREDLGCDPDEAAAEYPDAGDEDRDSLVEAEDTLIRKLGMLGRINPLALEEFQALEERHRFLSEQLTDLRDSKRDLEEVIRAVDDKIRDVFAEAFEDVAREFDQVFSTVFPGGNGKLVLTDPDDMLTTGIEVEARPPGKRVKRLSLLSGGERSLTALALLFAIFRARPSPFYVLDEVEAALDDVNLQRLLGVIESFKETSQLLVVTHQNPTMEIADVLYGVTMGSDAVSKVVAERMRSSGSEAVGHPEQPQPA